MSYGEFLPTAEEEIARLDKLVDWMRRRGVDELRSNTHGHVLAIVLGDEPGSPAPPRTPQDEPHGDLTGIDARGWATRAAGRFERNDPDSARGNR